MMRVRTMRKGSAVCGELVVTQWPECHSFLGPGHSLSLQTVVGSHASNRWS